MRIMLDVDGVLYHFERTARYLLRTVKGYDNLSEPSGSWDHIRERVSQKDWNWLWNHGVKLGLFRHGHLFTGAIEGVKALAEMGDVVIITHRPKSAVQDTLDWLAYNRFPISELHLLTEGQPKSSVLPHCDIYVDDKPENCVDLEQNTKGTVLLWSRPWNAGVPYMLRVASWPQVENIAWHRKVMAA